MALIYTIDSVNNFISKNPVDILNGGEFLKSWLKNEFINVSFNNDDMALIEEIRLFKEEDLNYLEDIETIKFDDESDGRKYWWIDASGVGSLQKAMRANGEIYHYGFKPIIKKLGVRPIISIKINNLEKIIKQ